MTIEKDEFLKQSNAEQHKRFVNKVQKIKQAY